MARNYNFYLCSRHIPTYVAAQCQVVYITSPKECHLWLSICHIRGVKFSFELFQSKQFTMLPNINTYIRTCLAHTAERIQGTVGGHLLTHTAIIMEQSNSQKEQEREREREGRERQGQTVLHRRFVWIPSSAGFNIKATPDCPGLMPISCHSKMGSRIMYYYHHQCHTTTPHHNIAQCSAPKLCSVSWINIRGICLANSVDKIR